MKRLTVLLTVLILLLSFGGCFGSNEFPLLIRSGGKTWEPYVNFLWAESYTKDGWLAADGISISRQFPDICEKLPNIPFDTDFALEYQDGVSLISIDIYDAACKPIQENTKKEVWQNLTPGTYYLVVTVRVQERYIAAASKYEYSGLECTFKLVVP